jgi:hypothetical protein
MDSPLSADHGERPEKLSHVMLRFSAMIEERAQGKDLTADDWAPLADLVAVKDFERVGAYTEVMNWPQYIRFLTEWAGKTRFEKTIRRISEVGNVVFEEIEERHYKGDDFIRKNVLVVYEFDDARKIRHLDIYEQARDSGSWIIEAAGRATETTV